MIFEGVTGRGTDIWRGVAIMTERFIGLFDLLGFKQFINSTDLVTLVSRAKHLVKMARTAVVIAGPEGEKRLSVLVFQDTVAVTTDTADSEDFRSIVQYASGLIGFGFSEGFLFRGAIVRGEAHVDETMIVGRGFIEAYTMEQNQEWIGCWIDDRCLDGIQEGMIANLNSYLILRCLIPLKTGPVRSGWAVNWTVPSHTIKKGKSPEELKPFHEAWMREWKPACTEGSVSWDVRRKLLNTDRFLHEVVRLGMLPPRD